ncbi:AraC family transcriptional regulator [Vineibacter terrae]|uniref:helix-turn-helix domain-containing protein n=1 Tax=Vineibacter terrae TaxID=2586908 RepID=UPI002E373E78|nr:AraC family transcriptional regulator [Vineibacter terrae]HEX2892341.1 AraC family transcriptional regulator [Vineibacter terrae]
MARVDRRNVTRYWWDRHTQGLSLLRADFTTHEYPPHTHEAFVIAITETGGSVIKSRGQVEEAHPATLFVFNPAEPHAGWMGWSHRWRYRSLYLTQSAIDTVARGLGIDAVPYFTRNMFGDADLIDAFLALHRALEDGRDALHEQELLIGTFGRLFQRHGSGGGRIAAAPRDEGALRRAIDMMQARHAEALPLEALAQGVDLTEFQLIGLFKRTVGLTPHAYLTQIRLNAACRHLRHGVPPADAATSCGFYDQSALNKHFKRCYGITPLQFARAARNFRQYPPGAAA